MSEFSGKKIAIALVFVALFGNNTSAMNNISKNEVKTSQTLGAVGGRAFVVINQKGLLQVKKQA